MNIQKDSLPTKPEWNRTKQHENELSIFAQITSNVDKNRWRTKFASRNKDVCLKASCVYFVVVGVYMCACIQVYMSKLQVLG